MLKLVAYIKLMVMVALNHLGLLKTSAHVTESTEEHQHYINYVLVLDRLCPSIVPAHFLTAYIKKLQVVEFGQVLN